MNSSIRNSSSAGHRRPIHREPEAHVAYLFRKLARMLRANRTSPDAKSVHQLRTTVRRIETFAASVGVSEGKGFSKFQKLLSEIFDKAGRVRDLDVQLEALSTISLPSVEDDKTLLHNYLQRQRVKRSRKLAETVDAEMMKRIPKRQRKAKLAVLQAVKEGPSARPVIDLKKEIVPFLEKLRANNFDTQTLHELRLDVKRVRYAAEAAGERGEEIVAMLKPVQDAIGNWHDWLNLIQTADKVLVPMHGHPLMTILRSKVRARFSDAIASLKSLDERLTEVLQGNEAKKPGLVLVPVEKSLAANAG
jgi:CHAD domain-containing protein